MQLTNISHTRFGASFGRLRQVQDKSEELKKSGQTFNENTLNDINASLDSLNKKIEEGNKNAPTDKNSEQAIEAANRHIDGLNSALNDCADSLDSLSSSLSGHVSVGDMATTADSISKGYDKVLKDATKATMGNDSTAFIEAWARNRFGDKVYDTSSVIKNGAGTAISGVGSLMQLGDTFGGSWRDPAAAAQKLSTGIGQIQTAVTDISQVANDVFKAVTRKEEGSKILGSLNLKDNIGMKSAGALAGTAAQGIGSIDAFRRGDISGGLRGAGAAITGAFGTFTGLYQWKKDKDNAKKESDAKKTEENETETSDGSPSQETPPPTDTQKQDTPPQTTTRSAGTNKNGNGSGNNKEAEDYGADMINEVNVIIDGAPASDVSCCVINGVKYKCSSYTLTQEMQNPMMLSFSMEKDNKTETQQDVIFTDATQLIGKSLQMNATTVKTSLESGSPQNAFAFIGMIVDVQVSRAMASSQTAYITAASLDSLMHTAIHCRSFEKKTLAEIVNEVIGPYGLQASVSPRLEDRIPYIVQYNQSDYNFLCMLATRFGEWMYSTGETFVFGEMNDPGGTAEMEYPGGSLMTYHVNQEMSPFDFSHLLTEHYKYGAKDDIIKKYGLHVADGKVNDWNERAYSASQMRYSMERLTALPTGGFDDWKSEEGVETIMAYSLKIEALGMKTGLMTVGGSSKLAMLKIGKQMLICDSVQNKSGENQDVRQNVLKIVRINHSFDYHQEYNNTFSAIPAGCRYPAYSNASVHPVMPMQRARVTDNEDEQMLGRIRVQFPWQEIQDKKMKTPWLRIATPYSGAEKGHLFIPEIGEEVLVGFEMDNAERPYIIGTLYNGGKGKADEQWAAKNKDKGTTNNIKAIRTRNGHTILFNDHGDKGILEIYDNKGNTYHITLSADDKKITITSAGDIEINADGDITMSSKSNISINASKEISIQASKVKVR